MKKIWKVEQIFPIPKLKKESGSYKPEYQQDRKEDAVAL